MQPEPTSPQTTVTDEAVMYEASQLVQKAVVLFGFTLRPQEVTQAAKKVAAETLKVLRNAD